MAIWITLSGLVVTAIVIVLFMPKYSYWAAAFGHLASYVVMFIISSVLGAKYYPIPYRWGRLALIVVVMAAIYGLSVVIDGACFATTDITSGAGPLALKLGTHTMLLLAYCVGAWTIIRK
jgi:O-antigen/teichoic acid export membrane protein